MSRTRAALSTGTELRVQYHHANDTSASDPNIASFLRIVNDGAAPVELSDLTLRYWYSAESASPQQVDCYWAELGCSNLLLSSQASGSSAPGADSVYEIRFSGGGSLPAGQHTGDIQTRVHASNWSAYDESNDYSYVASQLAWADAPKIALYLGGQLVWGTPPTGATTGCSDGTQNGSETDIDCGGDCPSCSDGSRCLQNSDCQSERCANGVCETTNIEIDCPLGIDVVTGTESVDNLNDVDGYDCIDALGGDDSINGDSGGEGAILGGAGNDQITVQDRVWSQEVLGTTISMPTAASCKCSAKTGTTHSTSTMRRKRWCLEAPAMIS